MLVPVPDAARRAGDDKGTRSRTRAAMSRLLTLTVAPTIGRPGASRREPGSRTTSPSGRCATVAFTGSGSRTCSSDNVAPNVLRSRRSWPSSSSASHTAIKDCAVLA